MIVLISSLKKAMFGFVLRLKQKRLDFEHRAIVEKTHGQSVTK